MAKKRKAICLKKNGDTLTIARDQLNLTPVLLAENPVIKEEFILILEKDDTCLLYKGCAEKLVPRGKAILKSKTNGNGNGLYLYFSGKDQRLTRVGINQTEKPTFLSPETDGKTFELEALKLEVK